MSAPAPVDAIELNDVESFAFLFKSLWSGDEDRKRVNVRILDTVLFKDGAPARWLFTSDQNGSILKRKTENMTSAEIVRIFRNKSRSMKGFKEHTLKSKIACVWYLQSKSELSSHLVDEAQLSTILKEHVYEVLAVQVFIGGWPLKGSGIFEHRYWVRSNGIPNTETFELVGRSGDGSVDGQELSTFSEGVQRLIIEESQHEMIRAATRKLVRHLEQTLHVRMANIVLQVVFNSAWVPYIAGARAVLLWDPPVQFTMSRNEYIYVGGDAPLPPSLSVRSPLLPYRLPHTSMRGREALAATSPMDAPLVVHLHGDHGDDAGGIDASDIDGESSMAAADSTGAFVGVQRPSRVKYGDEDLLFRSSRPDGGALRGQNANIRPLSAAAVPPHYPFESRSSAKGRGSTGEGVADAGNESGAMRSAGAGKVGQTLSLMTEACRQKLYYYSNQIKEQEELLNGDDLKKRRPISAPHALKSAIGTGHVLPGGHGVEVGGRRATGFERRLPLTSGTVCFGDFCGLLGIIEQSSVPHLVDPKAGASPGGHASSAAAAPSISTEVAPAAPAAAPVPQAEPSLPVEAEGSLVVAEGGVTSLGMGSTEHAPSLDVGAPAVAAANRPKRPHTASLQPAAAAVMPKPSHAPHQLPFRSVLLARAEIAYTNRNLLEQVEGEAFIDPAALDADQALAELALRHLNRVARKCQAAVRRVALTATGQFPPPTLWEAIDTQYRHMVYAEALSMVHPSRFYYTVPLCRSCFRLYSLLDFHRESVVLHPATTGLGKTPNLRSGVESKNTQKKRGGKQNARSSSRRRPRPEATSKSDSQREGDSYFHDDERWDEDLAKGPEPEIEPESAPSVRGDVRKSASARDRYEERVEVEHQKRSGVPVRGQNRTSVLVKPAPRAVASQAPLRASRAGEDSADEAEIEWGAEESRDVRRPPSHPPKRELKPPRREDEEGDKEGRESNHGNGRVSVGISTAGGSITSWVRILSDAAGAQRMSSDVGMGFSLRDGATPGQRPRSAAPLGVRSSAVVAQRGKGGDDGRPKSASGVAVSANASRGASHVHRQEHSGLRGGISREASPPRPYGQAPQALSVPAPFAIPSHGASSNTHKGPLVADDLLADYAYTTLPYMSAQYIPLASQQMELSTRHSVMPQSHTGYNYESGSAAATQRFGDVVARERVQSSSLAKKAEKELLEHPVDNIARLKAQRAIYLPAAKPKKLK